MQEFIGSACPGLRGKISAETRYQLSPNLHLNLLDALPFRQKESGSDESIRVISE